MGICPNKSYSTIQYFGQEKIERKGKAIPVTGRGGPEVYETSRFPHFLDNRFTDDGEVVSVTRRLPFTYQEGSWNSFLLEAELTPGS
jgi:hypothetical protein